MANAECRDGRSGRIFWGGGLVLLGGLALASELHLLGGYGLKELWPILPLWLGLSGILLPGYGKTRVQGVFWLLLGGAALLHTLHILVFRWQLAWPLVLIYFGLRALFGRSRAKREGGGRFGNWTPEKWSRSSAEECAKPTSSRLEAHIVMTGVQQSYEGREFEGGEISCTMSGYELDLRGATMIGDSAVLSVEATLGGIEIRVPRSWRVEIEASAILGAFEDKTQWVDTGDAKRLVIRGHVVLGGVEVRN